MKATIHDVAKRAGVSVATVSRVVNGNYPVREATRQQVQEAIDALDYVPNLQARELNMRQSFTIGVVIQGFRELFFAEALDSVSDYLHDHSYSMLLACAQHSAEQETASIRNLLGRNVCGIIVVDPCKENIEQGFYGNVMKRVPVVFLGDVEIAGASCVVSDERQGAMDALSHLLWLGHQRIILLRGKNSVPDATKEEAYRSIMEEAGILNENYILSLDDTGGVEDVDRAMRKLLEVIPRSDASAVFCCSDWFGVGAMNACRRLRKLVPRDISVIGFGNLSAGLCITPQLTTMDPNRKGLGMAAAKLLLEHLGSASEARRVVLEHELLERDTTEACKDI